MADQFDKQRQLAVRIAAEVSPKERLALQSWLSALLEIREQNLPWHQKAKRALSATRDSKVLGQSIKRIGASVKRHGWDKRSNTQRLGIGVAAVTAAVFGGANAGIAALGGAIGVPLWIVFGAGSMFAKMLYEELISGKRSGSGVTYTVVDAEREDD